MSNNDKNLSMIQKYFKCYVENKKKFGKIVQFWRCGSFFEIYGLFDVDKNEYYGTDIDKIAKILDYRVSNKMGTEKKAKIDLSNILDYDTKNKYLMMAGSSGGLETNIDKLQKHGYIVLVYEQYDNNDPTCKNKAKIHNLDYITSIGTNFNSQHTNISNKSICIWLDYCSLKTFSKKDSLTIGFSCIDINTGEVSVLEYYVKENNPIVPQTFFELEQTILVNNPSEIILIHNFKNNESIQKSIQYLSVKKFNSMIINLHNKNDYNAKNALACENQLTADSILQKHYNIKDFSTFMSITSFDRNNTALKAFCFLIERMSQFNNKIVIELDIPKLVKSNTKTLLCTNTLKQLNIIYSINKDDKCLLELLNNCNTKMGIRRFKKRLINPIFNTETLKKEYNIIDFVLKNQSILKNSKILRTMADLDRYERKIVMGSISKRELLTIYNNIKSAIVIYNNIKTNKKLITHINNSISENIYLQFQDNETKTNKKSKNIINNSLSNIIDFIEQYIDITKLQELQDVHNENFINLNFFNKNISESLDKNNESFQLLGEKITILHDFLEDTLRKNKKIKCVENKMIKKIIKEDDIYFEATKNRIAFLKEEYNKILKKKSYKNVTYRSNFLNKDCELKIEIDPLFTSGNKKSKNTINSNFINKMFNKFLTAYNEVKVSINAVFKNFIETMKQQHLNDIKNIKSFISLLDVVINNAIMAKRYGYCKPTIDNKYEHAFVNATEIRHPILERIITEEKYQPNSISLGKKVKGNLIYGTNTVGKSSLIKSVGMACIMAQAGLYVPASKFTFKPYKIICTRILNNDNIYKGLSTFAVEASELSTITRMCDENTLIIGDEICSGTETKSALTIMNAILDTLSKNNSSYLFATHFHELYENENFNVSSIKGLAIKHLTVVYDPINDCLVYDRKLKDGPGSNFYGIEVIKSFNFPNNFLELLVTYKNKLFPETQTIMEAKKNKYNRKHVLSCEECGNPAVDTHHLLPQNMADKDGIIENGFHKNHPANTQALCKKCHKIKTKNNVKEIRKKTTKGSKLITVN